MTSANYDIKDYIKVIDDVLPHELCDSILREYSNPSEWVYALVKNGVNKNIRNVQTIYISNQEVINKNLQNRKILDDNLFKCAGIAIEKYREIFPFTNIEKDTGYELLKYELGGFYTIHTDNYVTFPRSVSCSFALNDDYEGGEFAFFNKDLKIKLKKGSILMFPSNFMYPHEILPVTNGTRYSVITWFV